MTTLTAENQRQLFAQTNELFWEETGYKRGQKLDLDNADDRKMMPAYMKIYNELLPLYEAAAEDSLLRSTQSPRAIADAERPPTANPIWDKVRPSIPVAPRLQRPLTKMQLRLGEEPRRSRGTYGPSRGRTSVGAPWWTAFVPGAYDAVTATTEQSADMQRQAVEAARAKSASQPAPPVPIDLDLGPAPQNPNQTALSTPTKVAIGVGIVGALLLAGIAIGKA